MSDSVKKAFERFIRGVYEVTGQTIPDEFYPEIEIEKFAKLYTHPAKTLTDEEIEEVFEEVYKYKVNNLNMDFARAILRKAQEK